MGRINEKIYLKFTFIFFTIFLFSSTVLATFIGINMFNSLKKQSFKLQEEVSNTIGERVKSHIIEQRNKLLYLNEIIGIGNLSINEQKNLLSLILMQEQIFQEIFLIDPTGQETIRLSRTTVLFQEDLKNLAGDSSFQKPFTDGGTFFSPVIFNDELQEPLQTITIPVIDVRTGKPSFVMGISLRFKFMWNILSQIDMSDELDIFVTDNKGQVLVHKNPSLILQKKIIDLSVNTSDYSLLSGRKKISLTSSFFLGNQEFFAYTEQPFIQVFKPALESIYLTIIITLITIICAVPILYLVSRRITRPIEILVEAAERISRSDFSVRIETVGVDEVGYLSFVFNNMVKNLEESQDEIDRSAAQMQTTNKQLEITVQRLHSEMEEHFQTEKELRISNEKLHQSQKMEAIGQLAGGMAHDINNILGGIMGAAELIKLRGGNLNDECISYVDMITQSSDRASDLISKLLAFSRKNSGEIKILDINKILDDSVGILRNTIDKKISISMTKDADNHFFSGNQSSISSAIMNIGINASHAISDSGKIQISTKNIVLDDQYCSSSHFKVEPGKYIQIDITDTGCGIPDSYLNRIFEPFFTTKKQGSGTGLGLAAVYGTIQEHHGNIEVLSKVDEGTTFSILLPCVDEIIDHVDKAERTVAGIGTILYVDDEKLNRAVNEKLLESLGYRVLLAENGLQAVDIYREKHSEIDLVLMDMIMPKMNGSEAFYGMKKINDNCKTIITSGYSRDENIEALFQNGLAGYIQKPFKISEISRLLKSLISGEDS